MVSIMTALWFAHLNGDDKVAVKPHASPVYHAIKYLTGELDGSYLTTLRQRGGLQAYPSRTKDPDVSDFSTGSVGLGAVAPLFSALTRRYLDGPLRRATACSFHRTRRRRRARRGQHLGGDRGSSHPGPRQLHDGGRPQPAESRPGDPRHRGTALEAVLRERRLARDRGQVRSATRPPRSPVPAAMHCAITSTRCRTRRTSSCSTSRRRTRAPSSSSAPTERCRISPDGPRRRRISSTS